MRARYVGEGKDDVGKDDVGESRISICGVWDCSCTTTGSKSVDNDSDGWIDLNDPICTSINQLYENDGYDSTGSQCNDGIDNDLDGLIDFMDNMCITATDVSEAN